MRLEQAQEVQVRAICEELGVKLERARLDERILILNFAAPFPELTNLNALGHALRDAGFRWVSLELNPEEGP